MRRIRALTTLMLFACALTAQATDWTVVTTCEDGENLGGTKVTLRDAVREASAATSGVRSITFNCSGTNVKLSSPLVIPVKARPLEIDGRNGGRGMTLTPTGSPENYAATALLRTSGTRLTLRNLTFKGATQAVWASSATILAAENCVFSDNGGDSGTLGSAVYAEGAFNRFVNCAFRSNSGGAVYLGGGVLANCLLAGNTATGDGSTALTLAAGAVVAAAKCSFVYNTGGVGAVKVPAGSRLRMADTVFALNTQNPPDGAEEGPASDLVSAGALELYGVCAAAAPTGGGTVVQDGCRWNVTYDRISSFGICLQEITVETVAHTLFAPAYSTEMTDAPRYIWHDASWSNVVCTTDAAGQTRKTLLGSSSAATVRLDTDLTGEADEVLGRGAVRHHYVLAYTLEVGGGEVPSGSLPYFVCGQAPTKHVVPTHPGCAFYGWYGPDGKRWWNGSGEPDDTLTKVPLQKDVVLTARWGVTKNTFIVTSGAGTYDGDRLTLRQVLANIAEFPTDFGSLAGGTVTVSGVETITLDSTLVLPSTLPAVTLAGPQSGAGLTLCAQEGSDIALLRQEGSTLTLANVTLRGGKGAGAAVASSGTFRAENCVFQGGTATGSGGVVQLSGQSRLVNCSFTGTTNGAVRVSGGTCVLANATFVDGRATDGGKTAVRLASGAVYALHVTFGPNQTHDVPTANQTACLADNFAFDGAVSRAAVGALEHSYIPPRVNGSVTGNVAHVWHDADWSNVATSAKEDGTDKRAVVGNASAATLRLDRDLLGEKPKFFARGSVRRRFGMKVSYHPEGGTLVGSGTIWVLCDDTPSPGIIARSSGATFLGWWTGAGRKGLRYALAGGQFVMPTPYQETLDLYAGWEGLDFLFRVTSNLPGHGLPQSGILTLQDALDAAAENPDLKGPDGRRAIVFDCPDSAIYLTESLKIPAGTAPIIIDGRNEGRGMALYGKEGVRIFDFQGKGVAFENLSFYGARTNAPGGVAYVTSGTLSATNCFFKDNGATTGGAIAVDGGTAVLEACTLLANQSTRGGAAVNCEGGRLTVRNCMFLENVGDASACAEAGGSGALEMANCTVSAKTIPPVRVTGTAAKLEGCILLGGVTTVAHGDQLNHCTLSVPYSSADRGSDVATVIASATDLFTSEQGRGKYVQGEFNHVPQYWYEPIGCEGVVETTAQSWHRPADQLQRPAQITGRGSVRSVVWTYLTFEVGGGRSAPEPVLARSGDAPPKLTVPTRNLWTFDGWFNTAGVRVTDAKGVGAPGYTVPCAREVPLVARWLPTAALLVVTTGTDGFHPDDDTVSLRDALHVLATNPEFTPRTVSFDPSVQYLALTNTVTFGTELGSVAVDGWNGNFGVELSVPDSCSFFAVRTTVRLANLHLSGANAIQAMDLAGSSAVLTAENCAFTLNVAPQGSVAYLTGAAQATFVGCSFMGNRAYSGAGAALAAATDYSGRLTVAHCTFTQNRSSFGGAAADLPAGDVLVANCTFVDNTSDVDAGAALSVGAATVAGCAFAANAAGSGERGCVVRSGCTATLVRTSFADGYTGNATATDVATGCTETDLFIGGTTTAEVSYRGIPHTVFAPNVEASAGKMAQGFYLWHDSDWANVAGSLSAHDGGRVTLRGQSAQASLGLTTDEVGLLLSAPPRGAVASEDTGLVVTTTDDTVNSSDGKISLREAFNTANRRRASADADGYFTITFGDALFAESTAPVVVSLTNGTGITISESIRIRGRANVTLHAATSTAALSVARGGALALRELAVDFAANAYGAGDETNGPSAGFFVDSQGYVDFYGCRFTGSGTHNGCLLRSSGTDTDLGAVVDSCSFTGARCGTLALLGSRHYRVVNSTFSAVNAKESLGVLWIRGANDSLVANCSFFDCSSQRAALFLQPMLFARQHVAGCLVLFNSYYSVEEGTYAAQDIVVDALDSASGSKAKFYWTAYCGYSDRANTHTEFVNCTQLPSGSESEAKIFTGAVQEVPVGGVHRAFRPLSATGGAHRKGCYIFHDANWENVTCSKSAKYRNEQVTLFGDSLKADTMLAMDIVGRSVGSAAEGKQASPGSYATICDAESGTVGTIVVNSYTDPKTLPLNADDGVVSLREAVDYAQSNPFWRDADGNCVITFDETKVFGNVRAQTLYAAMRQIELTTFTNGTLVVRGPSDNLRSLTLDGKGNYRLFYVAPGNHLRLENLALENAKSQTYGAALQSVNGGAVYNAGMLEASNCTFRSCVAWATDAMGGAVYTSGGATTLVERCSFDSCRSTKGGALALASEGELTAVATTFADCATTNSSKGAIGVTGSTGGAVYVASGATRGAFVNCTFARNLATTDGGAIASAATSSRALYLVNCLLAGNASGSGGTDLHAIAGACVVAGAIGVRNAATWDADWDVTLGVTPSDLFARLCADGRPEAVRQTTPGPRQLYFPLRENLAVSARCVRQLDNWNALGHSAYVGGEVTPLYGARAPVELRYIGRSLTMDQIAAAEPDPPVPGAVTATESDAPVTPVPVVEDPLCVTNGSAAALTRALEYAVAHPELSVDGYVTVTFANNPTVTLGETLLIAASADVGLRLVGPATLDGSSAHRILTLEAGSRVRLENLTLANGYADGADDTYGGAVLAIDAHLSASNCLFTACTSGTDVSEFALAGAIEYWDCLDWSSGDFTDCRFENCTARGTEAFATILYHGSSRLALRGCTFDGADTPTEAQVAEAVRARIDRPSTAGTGKLFYATLQEALAECCRGDTLVRLVADASVEALKLPDGVSYSDESGANDEDGALMLASATQQLEDYATRTVTTSGLRLYSVRATSTRATLALETQNIVPELTGDGALIDLSGDAVVAVPANLVPERWYGLGRSTTPAGPYVVERWLKTDSEGCLPEALTAPKDGESGFYRVLMRE